MPVVCFAELVLTGLWAVLVEPYAPYTWFLPKWAKKESNVPKVKNSLGLTVLIYTVERRWCFWAQKIFLSCDVMLPFYLTGFLLVPDLIPQVWKTKDRKVIYEDHKKTTKLAPKICLNPPGFLWFKKSTECVTNTIRKISDSNYCMMMKLEKPLHCKCRVL